VQALVKGYLLPTKLHAAHGSLSPIHRDRLLRSAEYQILLFGVRDVEDILVLICGHGERDGRCGVMGPVLEEEFNKFLPKEGVEVLHGPVRIPEYNDGHDRLIEGQVLRKSTARVGLISHIGGHKFAGNVIIYIPKQARAVDGSAHALAGCGVWYGRVEPKHVEGIVKQTILGGTVIEEMFRGGITKDGEILRL
jgi:Sucrase/ferredoxin-like